MRSTWTRGVRAAFAVGAVAIAVLCTTSFARAALTRAEREVLVRYLDALQHERYDQAFARLSPMERHYFGSAKNFASAFTADRLRIASYRVVASSTLKTGVVAVVSQRIRFFDHAHQVFGTAQANVQYGVVTSDGTPAIKDPYHPWRAIAPAGLAVTTDNIRATVRKISFFTGRVEVVVTFANFGNDTVTLLPYGRTTVRDDAEKSHAPIETKLPGLTDRTLFEGLRLPPSGQYTGTMTFFTADRFAPKSLAMTFAPVLTDGGDAPFELTLPVLEIPAP